MQNPTLLKKKTQIEIPENHVYVESGRLPDQMLDTNIKKL